MKTSSGRFINQHNGFTLRGGTHHFGLVSTPAVSAQQLRRGGGGGGGGRGDDYGMAPTTATASLTRRRGGTVPAKTTMNPRFYRNESGSAFCDEHRWEKESFRSIRKNYFSWRFLFSKITSTVEPSKFGMMRKMKDLHYHCSPDEVVRAECMPRHHELPIEKAGFTQSGAENIQSGEAH